MKNEQAQATYRSITFSDFKQYCQKIVPILNDPEIVQKQNKMGLENTGKQILSYRASYKVLKRKFAKQHDCEYMEIQQIFKTGSSQCEIKVLLKINITYSVAYQIPLLLFMPYHIEGRKKQETQQRQSLEKQILELQSFKPFKKEDIRGILNFDVGSQKLEPEKEETGVFVIQNPINKDYFYSLHHCHMGNQGMSIRQLIPYYLGLLGIHPELIL